MKRVWTKKMITTLRKEYKDTPLDILAFKLGVTYPAVKAKALKLGIRKVNRFTEREDNILRKLYSDHSTTEIAAKLKGRTASSVYNRGYKLGLSKSKEFFSECGRKVASSSASVACRFQKGHIPSNKGKRLCETRSTESIERSRTTMFKKGHRPHNAKPIGYESVRDGYVYIKTESDKPMVLKHRHVWQLHHGEIPDGMCVSFRDGNRLNYDISNLVLITEAEKATRVTSAMTPEQHHERLMKANATRNRNIRRDKIRLHHGMQPLGKLVKRW